MTARMSRALLLAATCLVGAFYAPAWGAPRTSARFVPAACARAAVHSQSCALMIRVGAGGAPSTGLSPAGYTPADIQGAHGLAGVATRRGADQTIAVVDAFDDPAAEADLAVYRSTFHLPACTTANGCFHKLNQRGVPANYPPPDAHWAVETTADLDMASAACPLCHLMLVEADDNVDPNLELAVNEAANLHATVVSDSTGESEFPSETSLDQYFVHPGTPIVATNSDSGYNQVWYPAASPWVIAVGGISLQRSPDGKSWAQTAASFAGSGCSMYEPKPAWQHDPLCPRRMTNDVAAIAGGGQSLPSDFDGGVAIYDSYAPPSDPGTAESIAVQQLGPGWSVVFGDSIATPIVAAAFALAGNAATSGAALSLYRHANQLHDIVAGSNGDAMTPTYHGYGGDVVLHTCGNYMCNAGRGYDGPTGNGTPNGVAAF